MRDYLQSTLCIKRFHSRGQLCKLIGTKGSVISRWSMIVSVIVVLKRTNVDSDWHSDTLCGSHLQSQRELYQVSRWHETLAIDLIGQLSRDVIGRLSVKPSCYWLWRLLNVIGAFQTVFMSQLNSRFLLFRSSVIQSLCRKCSHKKKIFELPQDLFGTPTWPQFHCVTEKPIWPPWRHVKTLYNWRLLANQNWTYMLVWGGLIGNIFVVSNTRPDTSSHTCKLDIQWILIKPR